jgi:hypothetical protein
MSEDPCVSWLREHHRKLTVSNWLKLSYAFEGIPADLQDQPELLYEIPFDQLENDTDLQPPEDL